MNSKYSLRNTYPLSPKKVKILLIEKDWRVIDLAAHLGINQPTISKYINGAGYNSKIQKAIARALGVPLDAILLKPAPELEPRPEQSAAA